LDGIQAARAKACKAPAAERDTAGNEIGIQTQTVCVSDESFKIASQQRLPAGQIDLHDPDRLRFSEQAAPLFCV
jgi:hypothetical protein